MLEISTNLGASDSSAVWECRAGGFAMSINGTIGGNLTLMVCPTGPSGTFRAAKVQQPDGTFVDAVFTTVIDHIFFLPGHWCRIDVGSSNSGVSVYVSPATRESVVSKMRT